MKRTSHHELRNRNLLIRTGRLISLTVVHLQRHQSDENNLPAVFNNLDPQGCFRHPPAAHKRHTCVPVHIGNNNRFIKYAVRCPHEGHQKLNCGPPELSLYHRSELNDAGNACLIFCFSEDLQRFLCRIFSFLVLFFFFLAFWSFQSSPQNSLLQLQKETTTQQRYVYV